MAEAKRGGQPKRPGGGDGRKARRAGRRDGPWKGRKRGEGIMMGYIFTFAGGGHQRAREK